MLFSRTIVHGVYAICYLHGKAPGEWATSDEVAAAVGVPREHAAKILQTLTAADLVTSKRGRCGGYRLDLEMRDISVMDVFDALAAQDDQKHLRPSSCAAGASDDLCDAHAGLLWLRRRVRDALAEETLERLAGTLCTDTGPAETNPRTAARENGCRRVPDCAQAGEATDLRGGPRPHSRFGPNTAGRGRLSFLPVVESEGCSAEQPT